MPMPLLPLRPGDPATSGIAITPSDTEDLSEISYVYVGSSGDLRVTLADMPAGSSVTLSGVPAGYQPLLVKRVWAASTTATALVALTWRG